MSRSRWLPVANLVFASGLAIAIATAMAPVAAADNTADLKAVVDRTRAHCPALQQDPTLDGVAGRANNETMAYIEHTGLNSRQALDGLSDLKKLPPMPSMADKIDTGERFMFLDCLQMIRRGGI